MAWRKVCRYCGIGRASIIVILLIRHRFARKMSMKEQDLVKSLVAASRRREVTVQYKADNVVHYQNVLSSMNIRTGLGINPSRTFGLLRHAKEMLSFAVISK